VPVEGLGAHVEIEAREARAAPVRKQAGLEVEADSLLLEVGDHPRERLQVDVEKLAETAPVALVFSARARRPDHAVVRGAGDEVELVVEQELGGLAHEQQVRVGPAQDVCIRELLGRRERNGRVEVVVPGVTGMRGESLVADAELVEAAPRLTRQRRPEAGCNAQDLRVGKSASEVAEALGHPHGLRLERAGLDARDEADRWHGDDAKRAGMHRP
jgi:hypothetical protein